MILYTPLSYEDIHVTDADYQQYELITYQARPCYAERLENGDLRLIQLLSTNPSDYLHEQFTPGTIISTS
ncbi:YlzJ-like family protein [Gracilibacillus caseinilyticus]|uniref:YlzJ-like family protein n=1 Tax=Gracilibacillus caseinilyticus TaxID=2932256 RepID=A0ABY4EUB7_9BACI|nr:YlzJ-like family protein [Gracilibacillus caseinilyticus]UOQ47818.1 YlzJ-like family protein [Gracilibacillus caseinilyticus]